jgi:hypothetical protein
VRFDLFSSNRLYAALEKAKYPDLPRPRTLQDWIKNDSAPEGARLFVAEKVLGIKKDAAPEGAAEQLLKLWTGDQPPAWSNLQVSKVIEAIHQDRAEAMVAMARRLGRMTAAELQEPLSRLPDESSPRASDP